MSGNQDEQLMGCWMMFVFLMCLAVVVGLVIWAAVR